MERHALRASAHRLSNLLTVIVGNLDLARDANATGEELDRVERAAEEARVLVASLSAARELGQLDPLPLCATLRGFEGSLRRMLPTEVAVEPALPLAESWVLGERDLVRQLTAALVLDAAGRIRGEGTIDLRVSESTLIVEGPGAAAEGERLRRELAPESRHGSATLAFVGSIAARFGAELDVEQADERLRVRVGFAAAEARRIDVPVDDVVAEPAGPVRVLLVDDHTLMLDTLHRALAVDERIEIVGQLREAESAIAAATEKRPDVVLMDIDMPGLDTFEASRRLCALEPAPKVLILSAHTTDRHIDRAMRAGARGFLSKSESLERVRAAIRQVAAGRAAFSDEVLARVADPSESRPPIARLTERELEVLRGVVDGLARKEIAERLGISVKTVDRHVENTMRKLEIHDRLALARFAIREGLVSA